VEAVGPLVSVLADLAARLGMGAESVWPAMVKLTWAKALGNLFLSAFWFTVGAGFLLFGLRPLWQLAVEEQKKGDDGVVGSLAAVPDNLAGLLAPEAVTITDLLKKLKS